MKSNRINVTESFLPSLSEYNQYLKQIWNSKILTNQGQLLKEFESKLAIYLGVKYVHFVTNGTIALQIALRALDITEGEVITTPFSYVATVSSILWERCTPIFVDIDPKSLCIDTDKIESAITKKTRAIMPVHVFGIPCDVHKITKIAKKYKLKVIYDAAHAFGVKINNKGVFQYGDISVGSFHATKVFHTIEGGCLATNNKDISDKIELIKRFGHQGDSHYLLGINAKASEFQAAMGLCNLKHINVIIQKRKQIFDRYHQSLSNIKNLELVEIPKNISFNYGYFPVLFPSEKIMTKILQKLNFINIYPRRYFYPSLDLLPYVLNRQFCPTSINVSMKILCLPLSSTLDPNINKSIITTILDNL